MKTKHTKGEWKVKSTGMNPRFSPPRKTLIIDSENGLKETVVATICLQFGENELETEANANLIAAAPKLLKALNSLVFEIEKFTHVEDWKELKFAKEAIKKATSWEKLKANTMKKNRYTITGEFYIWADDDHDANEQSKKWAKDFSDKEDNSAEVLSIHETPEGSLQVREIDLE